MKDYWLTGLAILVIVAVAGNGYQWMDRKEKEMQLVYKDMRNIDRFLTKARDNCFGRWQAWTALEGVLPIAHFNCHEERKQSRDRVKMIKAER